MTTHDTPGAAFVVQFYCCGRDDGTASRKTWEEANALRTSYVESGRSPMEMGEHEGHQRAAVIVSGPTTHDTPEAVKFYWRLDLRTTVRISKVPLRFYGFRIRNIAFGIIR